MESLDIDNALPEERALIARKNGIDLSRYERDIWIRARSTESESLL